MLECLIMLFGLFFSCCAIRHLGDGGHYNGRMKECGHELRSAYTHIYTNDTRENETVHRWQGEINIHDNAFNQ